MARAIIFAHLEDQETQLGTRMMVSTITFVQVRQTNILEKINNCEMERGNSICKLLQAVLTTLTFSLLQGYLRICKFRLVQLFQELTFIPDGKIKFYD